MSEGTSKTINLKGEVCPFPWVQAQRALKKMAAGEILEIIVDHAPASRNIPNNFKEMGQQVLSVKKVNDSDWQIIVKKIK